MGRAGSGGGGGYSSGGHSSPTRSSSGHRVSSGGGSAHRAGSGGGYSSPRSGGYSSPPMSGGYRPAPPPHPPRPHYHGGYGYGHHTTVVHSHTSFRSVVASGIILVVLLILCFTINNWGGSSSTVEMTGLGREKLNASIAWNSKCIVDEINYIDNENATATGLKEFYDKTGIQPYVVFKAYDSSLTSDNQKQRYAEQWYESNISNEATVLYMYFEDTDTSVPGYMALIGGSQTKALWDDLAQNKFWDFIDMYWAMDESQMTTDKLITLSFVNTGKYLIDKGKVTTTESSGLMGIISKVVPFLIAGVVIVIILLVVIKVMKLKREHQAAENAETAAILNAPLDTADHSADDLVNKYK